MVERKKKEGKITKIISKFDIDNKLNTKFFYFDSKFYNPSQFKFFISFHLYNFKITTSSSKIIRKNIVSQIETLLKILILINITLAQAKSR